MAFEMFINFAGISTSCESLQIVVVVLLTDRSLLKTGSSMASVSSTTVTPKFDGDVSSSGLSLKCIANV